MKISKLYINMKREKMNYRNSKTKCELQKQQQQNVIPVMKI